MDTASDTEASNTSLNLPGGLAYDPDGDLYIVNTAENQVLEVSTAGVVSVVAGTGEQGFAGDGSAETLALLNRPLGIAIDSAGNVYIADAGNHRIREIDANGVIHTIAGVGVAGFSGDGGLATAAGLDSPQGVAVDSSYNLYISDTNSQRIRLVTYATGIISTLAGNGVMGFTAADGVATSGALAYPHGLTVDSSGTVYFADTDNQRIRSISSGQIATVAMANRAGRTPLASARAFPSTVR